MSNVGSRTVAVSDAVQGVRIPVRFLYPTRSEEVLERCGPNGAYAISVAIDAPIDRGRYPLVLISHGSGGSSLTYRDLAKSLAGSGFVVALLDHPGNCRGDNGLERTVANLENRPRHVRLAIDAALDDAAIGPGLMADKIAVIGHSMGGYTALAVAGGRPMSGPYEREGPGHSIDVVADDRVRALVLLAPACAWFWSEGALARVDVPILMFTAERDEVGPNLFADRVKQAVRDPSRVDHRDVPNAGHFGFQSPFPPEMTRADFPPSQDPEGFDRAAFQPVLSRAIVQFLMASLDGRRDESRAPGTARGGTGRGRGAVV